MDIIYKALLDYVKDEKILVDYLYVIYTLLDKYGKTLYDFVDRIKEVDEKLAEVLIYFKEENFDKTDVYKLLMDAISKTGYNVLEVTLGENVNIEEFDLPEWDVNVKSKPDDVGIEIKTADGKVYKRFLLEDVKRMLDL